MRVLLMIALGYYVALTAVTQLALQDEAFQSRNNPITLMARRGRSPSRP